jgi:hypothetical protein
MAYYDNLDEQNQQKSGAGGVIAGSGGAGSKTPTNIGTGFTNLQQYLTANKGAGGGIADNIISQGQNAVSDAQKTADTGAAAWADQGVQRAQSAGQTAASTYDTAAASLRADPNADITGVRGTTYGGPNSATEIEGYNDLDKAYQNVTNTAQNFAGDLSTQKAGLQKQYGYGSGFGALDTFLGRQDGRDKINNWATNVNPGSAQSQIARVTGAIDSGKQQVANAQSAFDKVNMDAKFARSMDANPQTHNSPVPGIGIADQVYDLEKSLAGTSTNAGSKGRNIQR